MHPVGDHGRRADEGEAAAATDRLIEGQTFILHLLLDPLLHPVHALVAPGVSHALLPGLGEVNAQSAGACGERQLGIDQGIKVVGLLPGNQLGFSKYDSQALQDSAFLGRPSARCHAALHIAVELTHGCLVSSLVAWPSRWLLARAQSLACSQATRQVWICSA